MLFYDSGLAWVASNRGPRPASHDRERTTLLSQQKNDTVETINILAVARKGTLKLVKDAIVFIKIAQFSLKMIVDRNGYEWTFVHVEIPDTKVEIISREEMPTVSREFNIGD